MTISAPLVSLLGSAGCVGSLGNPAIARMKGAVITVGPVEDETRICLSDPVDAGTTYGDRKYSDRECWSGILEGDPAPQVGDCVVLGVQGESSVLSVERAHGCG
jgi:hypothetical protein